MPRGRPKKNAEESAAPEGVMTHVQVISLPRDLSQKELIDCGRQLSKEELQLDQVRKEKKESTDSFNAQIKEHMKQIMKLAEAIETGTITDEIECEVVMNREKNKKKCYPKNNGIKPFELDMTDDDFDFLN